MGADVAWGGPRPARSRVRWVERRDLFAEGVASGDPAVESVLLWTRASQRGARPSVPLTLERSPGPHGGPIRYRVNHRVPLWRRGERPRLARDVIEGEPGLAL